MPRPSPAGCASNWRAASARQPPPVADAEAHAAYLEGRYYFARGTPDALAQAMACYERAIARDPDSALAYDSLAELYWYLGFFGNVPPREAFSLSTWNALRALELDDSLAQTHALLGMLRKELDYNWPEVDRELRRARQLNAESPLVRLRYAISGLLPTAASTKRWPRSRACFRPTRCRSSSAGGWPSWPIWPAGPSAWSRRAGT